MTQVNINPNPELLAKINSAITKITETEKVTKELLGILSRDILQYICVDRSTDIAMVNRLMEVLTPMNKRAATLFFTEFLPFKMDKETGLFTTMFKGEKSRERKFEASAKFLEDVNNNIWTWARDNVKMEQKPKDYAKKITSLVSKALSDEKEQIDSVEVLKAVMAGGIDVKDALSVLNDYTDEEEVQTAKAS